MNTEQLITLIQEYKKPYAENLEAMNYEDPTLYDYAQGIVDTCDFIVSKLQ